MREVLILGGAGFIGSNIAEKFVKNGDKVTIIDGLLERTGGNKKNIEPFESKINFIESNIENVKELELLINASNLIIDSMAWTSHNAAMKEPSYDLQLNCETHLHLIEALKRFKDKKVIFLSSRGVYGNAKVDQITEETEAIPEDIQGIHKLTSENYFRVYSKYYSFNTLVLRVPNCFGKNQPLKGEDIGLVGSFIRDSLNDNTIEVYGNHRKRALIYINDLVNAIMRIAENEWKNFNVYNVFGFEKSIYELASEIVSINKRGRVLIKEIPKHIKAIDMGNISYIDEKIKYFIGPYAVSSINDALKQTIQYFKENL